jgi:hypothetical protein
MVLAVQLERAEVREEGFNACRSRKRKYQAPLAVPFGSPGLRVGLLNVELFSHLKCCKNVRKQGFLIEGWVGGLLVGGVSLL